MDQDCLVCGFVNYKSHYMIQHIHFYGEFNKDVASEKENLNSPGKSVKNRLEPSFYAVVYILFSQVPTLRIEMCNLNYKHSQSASQRRLV